MLVEDQQEIFQEETKIRTVLFASCIDHIVETLVCVCVCVCVCGEDKRRMENIIEDETKHSCV